jgi:hypothetical protein
MPTTTPWSIAYPDANSNLTPLESHFQTLATTTNTGLTSVKNSIISTEIDPINDRLQLDLTTGPAGPNGSPVEGSMYWDSGSNIMYIYSRGGWIQSWHDMDWTNITVSSGFAAMSGNAPQYKIIGGVVYLKGGFAASGISATNTLYNIGTIPAGFRPATIVVYPGMTTANTPDETKITVSSAGVLSISVSTTGSNYYINGSYAI